MGVMKQSRKKKDSVAPMSDDEDTGTDSQNRPRQGSRGVSFSTSRGKIWLILIANLAIVTSFIFMSSSRFPFLDGEGMAKDVLEQDQPNPGPVIKISEHGLFEGAAVTKGPQIAPDEDRKSETKAPLANGYVKAPSERPATEEINDKDDETKPVVAVIEQTPMPTNDDTSSGFTSNTPSDGEQSPAKSTDQESLSETVPSPPEPLEELEYSSTTSKAELQAEDINQSAVGSEAFQDNWNSLTKEPSPTEKPLIEGTQQTFTTKDTPPTQSDHGSNDSAQKPPAAEVEDAAPTPKFDPRVNIFEWTPPIKADAAKATQWTKTVKDKVDYIRNFQLGGDVLRALIREHKDGLVALREELFG
ncbi:hypothetical protein V7S43_016673 [Phytophthora oleae]|uniref:RxLR effector protein n=1 Tax=Phytophthora oleae TaxID=2107226 RepID=A0ABD3EYP6_9STRA